MGVGVGVGDLSGFGFGEVDGVVEGSGRVGDGVGPLGEGEGVGEAVGEGEARWGVVKDVAGRLASARSMNSRHILAGNEPPTTAIPRTLFIALLLLA